MAEIAGLEVLDLPAGWTPLEASAVVKCLDEDGNVALFLRATETLSSWESLGMLSAARRATEDEVAAMFEAEYPDDQDGDEAGA